MQNGVVDLTAVATLISFFVPLLVALITKSSASDGLRAVVNMVSVAVVAVLALWINPSGVDITWQLVVNTFLASLVVSGGAYKFLWKPTGVTGTVVDATSRFGLGSPPTLETSDKDAENRGQAA